MSLTFTFYQLLGFETRIGYVEKQSTFYYWRHNCFLSEAGSAGGTDFANPDVTDRKTYEQYR